MNARRRSDIIGTSNRSPVRRMTKYYWLLPAPRLSLLLAALTRGLAHHRFMPSALDFSYVGRNRTDTRTAHRSVRLPGSRLSLGLLQNLPPLSARNPHVRRNVVRFSKFECRHAEWLHPKHPPDSDYPEPQLVTAFVPIPSPSSTQRPCAPSSYPNAVPL